MNMKLPDRLYRWVSTQNANLPLIALITFGVPGLFVRSIYNGNRGRDLWAGKKACFTLSFDCDYPEDVKAMPDTVRMMLTGNADQETAIRAVNEGNIFRFMNKPCPPELLESNIRAGLEQYRLITAERELLEKTLNGAIQVMAEILSQVNPAAFSRAYRIRNLVSQLVKEEGLSNGWEFSVAGLMSQLGCVSLPQSLVEKVYAGLDLTPEEEEMFGDHRRLGAGLLRKIPRRQRVASMIELQMKPFSEYRQRPEDEDQRVIWTGAQILKAVLDYDQLVFLGKSHREACKIMWGREKEYNANLLMIIEATEMGGGKTEVRYLRPDQLSMGMVLNQDVVARNGMLLASKGQEVTFSLRERLVNFSKSIGIDGPIAVQC